jgi:hypothetical protein
MVLQDLQDLRAYSSLLNEERSSMNVEDAVPSAIRARKV